MKVAIDLDGTAWSYPAVFSDIMEAMQKSGHQVGILTAHNVRSKDSDIDLFKRRGLPNPDFYIAKESEESGIKPRVWKPAMMKKHNIDMLWDDFDSKSTIEFIIAEKHKVR